MTLAFRLFPLVGEAGLEGVLCKPTCRLLPWSSALHIPEKSTARRPISCQLTSQSLLSPKGSSDGDTIVNHCADFLCGYLYIRVFSYAAAFALILSIIFLMPSHTDKSENTSTTLPLSVNGASCSTDISFIIPLQTIYSTI